MDGSSDSRMIISFIPRTAVMGVLISCDILERNADLASLAATALSVIFLSLSLSSLSLVIFSSIQSTWATLPSLVLSETISLALTHIFPKLSYSMVSVSTSFIRSSMVSISVNSTAAFFVGDSGRPFIILKNTSFILWSTLATAFEMAGLTFLISMTLSLITSRSQRDI